MGPIEELFSFDENNSWPGVFMKIRIDAMVQHDYSLKVSKKPEFKNRNRYGDVSPYDYSRICLAKNNIDYINASLVKYEPANRAYILTQGPLPGTSSHFWLMIWEQKSRAILMLNRIIEKGHIKCHQYFPTGIDEELLFEDVGLKVTFREEMQSHHEFTMRVLQLQNVETSESVLVMQFHYISWPDFGVPESPSAFLEFLFMVRSYGVLHDPSRPPVIHCSAGIGRSGTFCLVDTCLMLIQNEGTLENLRILDTLMEMRKCRMGLIQTHEQLRFSYLAIIEGAARINCLPEEYRHLGIEQGPEADDDDDSLDDEDVNINESSNVAGVIESTNDDLDLPPVPPRSFESLSPKTQLVPAAMYEDASLENHVTQQMNGSLFTEDVRESPATASTKGENSTQQELVKRKNREERVKRTRETIDRMKTKQQESESSKNQSQLGLFFYGGLSLAVAMLGFAAYKLVNYNH